MTDSEKLKIAIEALKQYTMKYWDYEDEYNHYPIGEGGWYEAEEALKKIGEHFDIEDSEND